MPTLSTGQLQTIRAVIAGVSAYLLSQPDVAVPPLVKVFLGAVVVACAILGNPGEGSNPTPPSPGA